MLLTSTSTSTSLGIELAGPARAKTGGGLGLLVLRRSPQITITLLTVLARRVRRLTERAEDSAFLDVKSRLAKRLVDLADQFGTPLGPRQVALKVRLSQQELGDMVQATRESVNKCLREWAREGISQRNGRQLVIEDRQRLGALAAG